MTSTLDSPTLATPTRAPSTPASAPTLAAHRAAGFVAIAGVGLAVVGSMFNQVVAKVDFFAAMETSSAAERAQLLDKVADNQTPLVTGFALWMIGFPLAALASVLLARLGRQSAITDIIRHLASASIGAILMFLSAFITFAVVIAPAHVAGEDVNTLARVIGYTATTTDWAVTAIVLGLAPVGAVYAGRNIWAPRWLQAIAGLTAAATVVEIAGLATGNRAVLFPVVPLGLLLLAGAGVAAIRHSDV